MLGSLFTFRLFICDLERLIFFVLLKKCVHQKLISCPNICRIYSYDSKNISVMWPEGIKIAVKVLWNFNRKLQTRFQPCRTRLLPVRYIVIDDRFPFLKNWPYQYQTIKVILTGCKCKFKENMCTFGGARAQFMLFKLIIYCMMRKSFKILDCLHLLCRPSCIDVWHFATISKYRNI